MKIKVNKNQFLDDYEIFIQRKAASSGINLTTYDVACDFKTEDVSVDTLLEYINKGYGIKINCK